MRKWAQFGPHSFIPRNDDLIDSHQMKNSSDFPLSIHIFRWRAHRLYESIQSISKYSSMRAFRCWLDILNQYTNLNHSAFVSLKFHLCELVKFPHFYVYSIWIVGIMQLPRFMTALTVHLHNQIKHILIRNILTQYDWLIFVPFTFSKSHLNDHLPVCCCFLPNANTLNRIIKS